MQDTDEISLVDILAVALRYRKMIIALPIIVTAIVGIYLYALPLLGITTSGKEYLIQYSVNVNPLPEYLKDRINVNVVQTLNSYFSSVPLQIREYGKYFPKDISGLKDGELTTFIKMGVIGKTLKFSLEPKEQQYSLSFKTKNKENGQSYLSSLWSGAMADVLGRLSANYASALLLLDQTIKVFDNAKKLDAESLNGKALLVNTQQSIIVLQDNPNFPFNKTPEQLVTIENGGGRIKTMLITFFASLFIAFLGAFLLQAARDIKDDPESMQKIRAALVDGKRKL